MQTNVMDPCNCCKERNNGWSTTKFVVQKKKRRPQRGFFINTFMFVFYWWIDNKQLTVHTLLGGIHLNTLNNTYYMLFYKPKKYNFIKLIGYFLI